MGRPACSGHGISSRKDAKLQHPWSLPQYPWHCEGQLMHCVIPACRLNSRSRLLPRQSTQFFSTFARGRKQVLCPRAPRQAHEGYLSEGQRQRVVTPSPLRHPHQCWTRFLSPVLSSGFCTPPLQSGPSSLLTPMSQVLKADPGTMSSCLFHLASRSSSSCTVRAMGRIRTRCFSCLSRRFCSKGVRKVFQSQWG